MIRIDKGEAPDELVVKGKKLTKGLCDAVDKDVNGYLNGSKTFEFKGYGLDTVKAALKCRQHNKCCFSEARFTGEYPPIEHFRPKGRVDIYGTEVKLYPGYYWLAYEWSNLFYCKPFINTTCKRNFFPLYNELERNRTHRDSFTERSILIDPSVEEPRDFIRFVDDEPVGVDDEGRGHFNIIFLGLRHSSFVDDRSDKFIALQRMKDTIDIAIAQGLDINSPILQPNLTALREAVLPTAEFSSMAINLLQGWPHLESALDS